MTVVEIPPLFRTNSVNSPVRVYSGPGTLLASGGPYNVDLDIDFRWLPNTGLFVSATFEDAGPIEVWPTDVFRLPDGAEFSIEMIRMLGGSFTPTSLVEGWILDTLEGGTGPVRAIRFEVPNLPSFRGEPIRTLVEGAGWIGRKVLEADGWRVTLDSIRGHGKLREELRTTSGYALLDTGAIERVDGADFEPDDASDKLEALRVFLSFCSGRWVAPILFEGSNSHGASIWYRRSSPTLGPWRGHFGCLPEYVFDGDVVRMPDLNPSWVEFLRLWGDPNSQDVLCWAISWYVEANSARNADLALSLAQAGLEVLAFYELVVLGGMKRKVFEKDVRAVEKIRRLLAKMNVRPTLSNGTGIGSLFGFAHVRKPRLDGPEAFTQVRNSTIHPRTGPGRADPGVRIDASRLGLSYLELGILHLLGYRDYYLDKTFTMKETRVPWGDSVLRNPR